MPRSLARRWILIEPWFLYRFGSNWQVCCRKRCLGWVLYPFIQPGTEHLIQKWMLRLRSNQFYPFMHLSWRLFEMRRIVPLSARLSHRVCHKAQWPVYTESKLVDFFVTLHHWRKLPSQAEFLCSYFSWTSSAGTLVWNKMDVNG